MQNDLSREAMEKIDRMVERVARKAGYTGTGNMTYKELLQAKFEQSRDKMRRKLDKYRHKFSLKPGNRDFAEEIRTYLRDGLIDLMKEGRSEEEALRITMEKFDEAELNEGFDEFVQAFGGFGMQDREVVEWYAKSGEAIGLFYAAFAILGVAAGGFCGFLFGHTLVWTLSGLGVGFLTGTGLGLLSHAIIALRRVR